MSGPRAPHSLRHEPQSTPLKFEEALNAQYAVIRNGDNVSHSVSGWTVRDKGLFGSKDGFGFCGRGVTRLQQAGSGAGNDQSL
jgi:hypothetical protein